MTKRLKFELNKELIKERLEELFETVTDKLSDFGIDIWIEDDEKTEAFVPGHLEHLHVNLSRAWTSSFGPAKPNFDFKHLFDKKAE